MKHKSAHVFISDEIDIAKAVDEARILAEEAGFKQSEQYMVATAVSELARNIVLYAIKGEIAMRIIERKNRRGIEVVAEDNGPGIKDIAHAMKDGFSTGGGLGLGLSGVKRLMGEFLIDTKRRIGTKITVKKWV